MSGWISLHRKIMTHPFYTEKRKFSKYEAWLDIILLANHQDNKFIHGNKLVEVHRGSFITSELKLMERWDWGKEKLRSFLKLLESDKMIVKISDRKQTTIKVLNYNDYQTPPDHRQTDSRPLSDHERTVTRPSPDTNNNENNDNNFLGSSGNSRKNVFGMYQSEIGELSETIKEELIHLELEYTEEWVFKAIKEAVMQDVKKMAYIKGALKKWKTFNVDEPWLVERQQPSNVTQFPKGGQVNARHEAGHAGRTNAELDALSL